MMDEFIHWPNPYLLLSATCDEILSWLFEIWMKGHLVSNSNRNTINVIERNRWDTSTLPRCGNGSAAAVGEEEGRMIHV